MVASLQRAQLVFTVYQCILNILKTKTSPFSQALDKILKSILDTTCRFELPSLRSASEQTCGRPSAAPPSCGPLNVPHHTIITSHTNTSLLLTPRSALLSSGGPRSLTALTTPPLPLLHSAPPAAWRKEFSV